jgi:hypothetical protein
MEKRQPTLIAVTVGFALGVLLTVLLLARDPWNYGTEKGTFTPLRYNRSTGESQILRVKGWEKLEEPAMVQFVPDPK